MVEMEGEKYLDGGITDSIPLEFFQKRGYTKNIVVLTQPEGYQKKPMSLLPLMKWKYRKYPNLIKVLENRHEMYNAQLEYVKAEEKAGRCIVIRPKFSIEVGHFTISPDEMQRIYDLGREAASEKIDQMKEYLGWDRLKYLDALDSLEYIDFLDI